MRRIPESKEPFFFLPTQYFPALGVKFLLTHDFFFVLWKATGKKKNAVHSLIRKSNFVIWSPLRRQWLAFGNVPSIHLFTAKCTQTFEFGWKCYASEAFLFCAHVSTDQFNKILVFFFYSTRLKWKILSGRRATIAICFFYLTDSVTALSLFENIRSPYLGLWTRTWTDFKRFLQFQNLDSISSSETGVNPGTRSWKKHLSEWARCQTAIGGIYVTKKWRAETLQPGLEFDYFKPWLESGIFKCISWLNGSFFGRWWSGFSERGRQDLSNGSNVSS